VGVMPAFFLLVDAMPDGCADRGHTWVHAFTRESNTIAILLHWRSPENGLLKEFFKIPLENM